MPETPVQLRLGHFVAFQGGDNPKAQRASRLQFRQTERNIVARCETDLDIGRVTHLKNVDHTSLALPCLAWPGPASPCRAALRRAVPGQSWRVESDHPEDRHHEHCPCFASPSLARPSRAVPRRALPDRAQPCLALPRQTRSG